MIFVMCKIKCQSFGPTYSALINEMLDFIKNCGRFSLIIKILELLFTREISKILTIVKCVDLFALVVNMLDLFKIGDLLALIVKVLD